MATANFCEFMRANDYHQAFDDVSAKIASSFNGNTAGTIASTALVEYPIKISDVWDESDVFLEAHGFMERDSYGEVGKTTVLDCGSTGNGDERMWVFYGTTEL